jgi:hypothetical protein
LVDPPQGVINDQLVNSADIVIALFDSRLGMATKEAVSGTAEEIKRADEAGKPVHVWFSEEPLPRNVDVKQLEALMRFKEELGQRGLLGSYTSPEDLGYKVRQAIERDLDQLQLAPVHSRGPLQERAVVRARYDFDREPETDNKGRVRIRTRRERLVVRNQGTAPAKEVRVEVRVPTGVEGEAPQLHTDAAAPTIIPDSEFSWPMMMFGEVADTLEVVMTWTEHGEECTEVQHIAT